MPRLKPDSGRVAAGRGRALQDRAQPLIDEATERSRLSLRQGLIRLRDAWRPILQIAAAATVAWLIATEVLGHAQPFFAPVAAIITLGITQGERGRRAYEIAFGVTLGLVIGDALALVIGTGAIQLGFVLILAMSAAVFLGSGQILATQAAVSAALVITLQPPNEGVSFARSIDGLTGCAVALIANAVVLPADPLTILRQAAGPVVRELAAALEDVAGALRARSIEQAEAALVRAREIDRLSTRLQEAVDVGRETARWTASRRGTRGRIDVYARAAEHLDFAVRNVRVLARGSIRALRLEENVPPEVADAVDDLAAATRAIEHALEGRDRRAVKVAAQRAAARATLVLEQTGNMSVSVIVGQIRSTAVDLLRAAGSSDDEANDLIRRAVREAERGAVARD
jgi:uncharacterized membrane protein YgaE (UPF0421/DUF939 family)